MKKLLLSLFLVLTVVVTKSQTDSLSSLSPRPLVAPLAGTALVASGAAFTFVPALKQLEVDLRLRIQADGHTGVPVEDYVQYLPAVTAPALNVGGLESRHTLGQLTLLEGGSYLLGAAILYGAKYGFGVLRPDGSAYNSFPSGHTFTSFVGAEVVRLEYGEDYPWVAVTAYVVATAVGGRLASITTATGWAMSWREPVLASSASTLPIGYMRKTEIRQEIVNPSTIKQFETWIIKC